MNFSKIEHLHSLARGGVSDYVDICLKFEHEFKKNQLVKQALPSPLLPKHCLLHYSGYGYDKRGAPLWLLKKIKADRPQVESLGIFFHELYALGSPWGSAFWLSPVQRHISSGLAEMSDYWITNRDESAQWLRRFAGNKPHAVLPVFSNVGETLTYSSARVPKVVVFGGEALRQTTYRAAGNDLFSWAQTRGLTLHDVGPSITDSTLLTKLRLEGVVQHGCIAPDEVSKILQDASFGVVAYPANYVAKSGVFAAYCAHGVCPILISARYASADRLAAGVNYLAGLPKGSSELNLVQSVGLASWNWYQPHAVVERIRTIKRLFTEANGSW